MHPLPDDVLALMRCVIELVDLLYWKPVPYKGSKGDEILAQRALLKRKKPERTGTSSKPQYTETLSGQESGIECPSTTKAWKSSRRLRRLDWLADADLETRGLMEVSGYGAPSLLFNLRIYQAAIFPPRH